MIIQKQMKKYNTPSINDGIGLNKRGKELCVLSNINSITSYGEFQSPFQSNNSSDTFSSKSHKILYPLFDISPQRTPEEFLSPVQDSQEVSSPASSVSSPASSASGQ
eukprot:scpid78507/ scgid3842/ 